MKTLLPIAAIVALASPALSQTCTSWEPTSLIPLEEPVRRSPVCYDPSIMYEVDTWNMCDFLFDGADALHAAAEADLLLEEQVATAALAAACDDLMAGIISQASYDQIVNQISVTYSVFTSQILATYEAAKAALELNYTLCLQVGCEAPMNLLPCSTYSFFIPPLMISSWYNQVPDCEHPISGCADRVNAKWKAKYQDLLDDLNAQYQADLWIFMEAYMAARQAWIDCPGQITQECCDASAALFIAAEQAWDDLIAKRGVLAQEASAGLTLYRDKAKDEIATLCCP